VDGAVRRWASLGVVNGDPTVLLGAEGQELLARVAAEIVSGGGGSLAVGTRLRREYPAELVAAAMAQGELRLAARAKFSRAADMLFTRAGYEQSSSEPVARYRAARFGAARRVADLCCGIGGDLVALAAGREALAVDRDITHARLAVHNAGVYGVAANVRAVAVDVREPRFGGLDAVFIDPARRAGSRRFAAGDSEPPLAWCFALADVVPGVCVKAAPGLPAELIPDGWEAEFVADGRDLKEAVLWSGALAGTARRATVLTAAPGGPDQIDAHPTGPQPDGPARAGARMPGAVAVDPVLAGVHTISPAPGDPVPAGVHTVSPAPGDTVPAGVHTMSPAPDDPVPAGVHTMSPAPGDPVPGGVHTMSLVPGDPVPVAAPGEYLLDPNPAVTRAGLVEDLARALSGAAGGAAKIDPRIAFLTAERPVRTPFARTLRVLDSAPWNEKRFAVRLRELDIGAVDIRRRGLAGDVDAIRRRLKPAGSRRATVVITRVNDQPWGLVCVEP